MMCLQYLRQMSLANPTKVHFEGQLTECDDMHFTGQHLADFMAKLGHLKKIKHSKSDYKRLFPQVLELVLEPAGMLNSTSTLSYPIKVGEG